MNTSFSSLYINEGPLIATAIHNGHEIRDELKPFLNLSEAERLREEDLFTSRWVTVGNTQIIVNRSRFEVDVNRPRDKAVYLEPDDAWGLQIWRTPLDDACIHHSTALYDDFYATLYKELKKIKECYGKFVVFDIHAYNHRRQGPNETKADPDKNPDINIGTSNMNESLWRPLVNRFISDCRSYKVDGRQLDVRENVKFRGGHMAKWIHNTFSDAGLALAVEVKKFYMDEWTGKPNQAEINFVRQALSSTVKGVLQELKKLPT